MAAAIDPAPILRWIADPAARRLDAAELLPELGARLDAAGLDVRRISTSVLTMHPEVYVRNLQWDRAEGTTVKIRAHGLRDTDFYLASPVAAIHAGSGPIRCRLAGPGADADRYPITRELRDAGATDYLATPLELSDGRRSWISFTTHRDGGYNDAELELIDTLLPFLSMRFELEAVQFATRGLLEVYLGRNAAARVLSGAFKRGDGASIHAAIWFCDLRNFTAMSDARPASEVVATLDRYFEAVAAPIDDAGGEILKFIGDAVLAIFPTAPACPAAEACRRALQAADGALANLAALNREREGEPPLAIGIALHLGDVLYGNIGGRERLDFTVIGAAVNEACRVESLCKQLGAPILVTDAFARALPEVGFEQRGEHSLRGVSTPRPLFSPAGK